ncbi:MAG: HK97 gp10 family phage protein [Lachnospiraceae bacterium]|nr:HK97 gp10 family phage protein [Lachnospiraceae bacterium]
MASFTCNFPADLEKQLLALQRAGEDAALGNILAAGGAEVEKQMKGQLSSHRDTGSMVNSVKTTKAAKNDKGYFVVTRPTGKDAKGVRNMEKLAYLHYGTSKQRATGIVTKIVNRAETSAVKAMQAAFEKEAGL